MPICRQRKLVTALEGLLNCTDLNVDPLDASSIDAIDEARTALANHKEPSL